MTDTPEGVSPPPRVPRSASTAPGRSGRRPGVPATTSVLARLASLACCHFPTPFEPEWIISKGFDMRPAGLLALDAAPWPGSNGLNEDRESRTTSNPLGEHGHELTKQVRRTLASAVMLAQHMDAVTPPGPKLWQYHQ